MTAVEPPFDIAEFVRRVLAEDLGAGGDVTSRATIAPTRASPRP
jgi:nicotinate-nucleotide pyrophosphorylase